MASATTKTGLLIDLDDCYVKIKTHTIKMRILPEIGDGKSAAYNDEVIMGRSFPLKTYSHSENRAISMTIPVISLEQDDISKNQPHVRALESAVYPRDAGDPFLPPPICRIKCGKLLGDKELCVILKSYSIKFPTDVVWDEDTYWPQKFDIEASWEVVYKTSDLPGQERIFKSGR